jgi:ABC-type polysaccharide/polyol phosphate export permease
MENKLSLLKYFLVRDIKVKYAGSALGILWTFLMPALQILIYWFVFSTVMRIRPYSNSQIPYVYYLLSTFFFWLAVSDGISRSGTIFIENAELVKKVSFPNIVLPVSVTLSGYLHHFTGVVLAIIIFTFSGLSHIHMFFIIPVLILQIFFSIGIGLLMAAIVPYIRDIQQIIGYVLQGMFFLSPIIYPLDAIPERFRLFAFLNPITVYIESYHSIIFKKQFPETSYIFGMIFISCLSLFIGIKVFNKLNKGLADIL